MKRITLGLEDDAVLLLRKLAGSNRKQGIYLTNLLRRTAATGSAPRAVSLEEVSFQIDALSRELAGIRQRLRHLEDTQAAAVPRSAAPLRGTRLRKPRRAPRHRRPAE